MNGLNPDDFDPIKAWGKAQQKAGLPFAILFSSFTAGRKKGLLIFLWLLVAVLCGVALWNYWYSTQSEYWISIYLELASAGAFFLGAPFVITLGRRWRWPTPALGLLIGGALLFFAAHEIGKLQGLLIEFGVAVLALVVLEIILVPMRETIELDYKEAKEALAQYRKAFDESDG